MKKQFYFIAGLPRSGSTLLGGLLNQNPSIHGSMTTSLIEIFNTISKHPEPFIVTPTPDQASTLFKFSAEGFYNHIEKPIVFDTNRGWLRYIGILPRIFPGTKIILCMRDIPSILNSFENHYLSCNIMPTYISNEAKVNPFFRIEEYFQRRVAEFYDNCDYVFYSQELKKHCIFVDYDELIVNPNKILENLYNKINLPFFNHNFENINHSFDYIDNSVGNHNLHKVHTKLGKTTTKWIIPPGLVEKYSKKCFWKDE